MNWDFKRLLLSKMATKYVRIVTGMPFSDTTGGFKCWRAGPLQAIGLYRVFSSGYLFQIEMTYRTLRKGYGVAEIPIVFYERNLGRSKMDWRVIGKSCGACSDCASSADSSRYRSTLRIRLMFQTTKPAYQ